MPNVSATHLLLAALFNLVPRTFLPFRNVDSHEEKHSGKKRWGRVCVPRVSALDLVKKRNPGNEIVFHSLQ